MAVKSVTLGRLGSGDLLFEVVDGWGRLPDGWSYGEVVGVAVDSKDLVYALTRSSHPVLVFSPEGEFLRSWGQYIFPFPGRTHAITIDGEDQVYCVDDRAHTIYHFNTDGELQRMIGSPRKGSKKWSGEPLNLPTDVAISPRNSDIYVTDGYGNSRIHRYSPKGELIHSWGAPGTDPGEFVWPHGLRINEDGIVFVCDRENNRVQVFDEDGKLLDIWHDVYRPCAIAFDNAGRIVLGELCSELFLADAPNIGHRISIFDQTGKLLARLGEPMEGEGPGEFIAPHGLAVDSTGAIYVAEVSWSMRGRFLQPPREMRTLQKLQPVEV